MKNNIRTSVLANIIFESITVPFKNTPKLKKYLKNSSRFLNEYGIREGKLIVTEKVSVMPTFNNIKKLYADFDFNTKRNLISYHVTHFINIPGRHTVFKTQDFVIAIQSRSEKLKSKNDDYDKNANFVFYWCVF